METCRRLKLILCSVDTVVNMTSVLESMDLNMHPGLRSMQRGQCRSRQIVETLILHNHSHEVTQGVKTYMNQIRRPCTDDCFDGPWVGGSMQRP